VAVLIMWESAYCQKQLKALYSNGKRGDGGTFAAFLWPCAAAF